MKMYDCDVCMSAGSVNQWGYCEICGEDFEDAGSLVRWYGSADAATIELVEAGAGISNIESQLTAVGQDAA